MMDQRLQQAIDAARTGATDEAQRLLTQVLKDDPDQVQAWFLLSHLVDSETKQAAFLQKVLALDPNHTQARGRLAHIRREAEAASKADTETGPAISISDEGLDMEDQATGETLPSWMTEADAADVVDTTAAAVTAAHEDVAEEEQDEEPLPDWLLPKPVVEDVEPEAVEAAVEVEKTLPVKTPTSARNDTAKKPSSSWNLLLIFLVIVAIVIFYFLIRAALPML